MLPNTHSNATDSFFTPDPAFSLATTSTPATGRPQPPLHHNDNGLLDNSAYSLPSAGPTPSWQHRFSAGGEPSEAANASTTAPAPRRSSASSSPHEPIEPIDTNTASPPTATTAMSSVNDHAVAARAPLRGGACVPRGDPPFGASTASRQWTDADVAVTAPREDDMVASSVVLVQPDEAQKPLLDGQTGVEMGASGPAGREEPAGSTIAGAGDSKASWNASTANNNKNKKTTLKRSYGNVRPILGGYFVVNEDSWHAIVVVVLIVVVVVIFLAGVPPAHEWWTFLVVILLTLGSVGCALLCVSLDPGILEPRPADQEPHKLNQLVKVTNKDGASFDVSCAVCRTCHIRRPPRSTHCHFCDVCVEEFDHHCGVMGSCVGKRTFRFFAGFFMITTVLCLYVAIRAIVFLAMRGLLNLDTPRERYRVAAAFISAAVPAMFLFLLAPFSYVYLRYSCLNWTEKEHLRATSKACCAANEPYDEGCGRNLVKRLCGPLGERHVREEYWV